MVGGDSLEKRYELVERIAVGGMAEVFRAKAYGPHGFEKLLAIKRILPTLSADPAFERRFIDEAKVAVSLSHANIVQVFDFSRFGQSMYIVMELVDGCDLAHLLKVLRQRGELIPVDAALHIAVDMLKGLDFAHRRKVIHRDVSPSNILLSRHGEVKIADFGIAKVAGFEASRSMRIMGKWRYMSPEQTQAGELDVRSDVFSAASVIFEVLTGRRLFQGSDAEHIVRSIRTMPIPSIAEIRPELPGEIDRALGRALERDRERRYASAGELLEDVLEVCYARSVPALPTSLTRFLEQLGIPDRGTGSDDSESTSSDRLLDEILASELGIARKAGAAGERKTGVALGPPRMHPDDLPDSNTPTPRDGGAALDDTGSITVIRSIPDRDGSRRWALEGPLAAELGDDLDATTTLVAITDPPVSSAADTAATEPELPAFDVPDARPESAPARGVAVARPRWPLWAALAGGAVIAIAVVAMSRSSRGEGPDRSAARAAERSVASPVPADAGGTPIVAATAEESVAPTATADAGTLSAIDSFDAGDGASMDFVAERVGEGRESDSRPRPPRTATIDIYSEPWANVYLGRRKVGVAPQRGLRLPVGRHRLKLVNPVQKRQTTVMVTVPADGPIRVSLP